MAKLPFFFLTNKYISILYIQLNGQTAKLWSDLHDMLLSRLLVHKINIIYLWRKISKTITTAKCDLQMPLSCSYLLYHLWKES
jgi:hypothetical protein